MILEMENEARDIVVMALDKHLIQNDYEVSTV